MNNSLNISTSQKQTQISKFLDPKGSTFKKLDDSLNQSELSQKVKKSQITKKSSIRNFFKLNDSKYLDESLEMNDNTDSKCSKYFQETENKEIEDFYCPICSIDLTYDKNRQTHVNECLDKGFSKDSKNHKKPPKQKMVVDNDNNYNKNDDSKDSKNIKLQKQKDLKIYDFESDDNDNDKKNDEKAQLKTHPKKPELMMEDAVPNCPICSKLLKTLSVYDFF